MMQVSPEILSAINEAALLVCADIVEYANPAAKQLFGEACVGMTASKLLGSELAGIKDKSCLTERSINGRTYSVHMTETDGARLIVLRPFEVTPMLVSEAFLVAMRNSLMNIILSIDAQRDGRSMDGLRSLKLEYYRMLRLINNLSMLKNYYDGQLQPYLTEFSLSELCENALRITGELFPKLKISLKYKGENLIVADKSFVTQILLNLISNCIIHAEGMSSLSVGIRSTGTGLMVSVCDNGCGIAPDKLASIFERYSVTAPPSELLGGAGLGLAVSRGMVSTMGGVLLVESKEGEGTGAHFSVSGKLKVPELRSYHQPEGGTGEEILTCLSCCICADAVDLW